MPDLTLRLVASPTLPTPVRDGLELAVRDSSPDAATQGRAFSGARDVAWVTDFHAKRIALLEAVGFGWMPEHLIESDLDAGRLVAVEGPSEWTYHPRIARRRGQALGRGAALFLDQLR